MNNLEKKMVENLIELKENYHVIGVKAEFETEGTRIEEALRLKEIITKAGLNLTIKIGGCEAIKDMHEAKIIGISNIVAPMIETPYALKKYISAVTQIFPPEIHTDIDYWVNIETITGYNNYNEMLKMQECRLLKGIVLGRVDLTGSMGISRELVNSKEIFDIAKDMAIKAKENNLELIIGGEVSAQSIPFFKALPTNTLTKYETRKIIFDSKALLNDANAEKGIQKALNFELMWLQNKRNMYGTIALEDQQRIQILESRNKKSINSALKMANLNN